MYRIESSGPYSAPADGDFKWHWVPSPCCGHLVRTWVLAHVGLPDGALSRLREDCDECQVTRRVAVATGSGGEAYLEAVAALGLPARSLGFDEHDFWGTWVTRGREAAYAEALAAGYPVTARH